jgi:DNA-directed RNA polymerase I, II, and III subunit RPABC1
MNTEIINENISLMMNARNYIIQGKSSSYPTIFKKIDSENKIFIFREESTIDKKKIALNVQNMKKNKVTKGIIVSKHPVSKKTRTLLYILGKDVVIETGKKSFENIRCTFEIFEEIEFMINLVSHESIPKHIEMTDEEKILFLTSNKIVESQLPKITLADPIVRYYNFQKGSCIKIIRLFEDKESIYIRLVV